MVPPTGWRHGPHQGQLQWKSRDGQGAVGRGGRRPRQGPGGCMYVERWGSSLGTSNYEFRYSSSVCEYEYKCGSVNGEYLRIIISCGSDWMQL